MDKFNELLLNKDSLGYVHQLAVKSEAMLQATLKGDTATMSRILEFAHNTETPLLAYNNETERLLLLISYIWQHVTDIMSRGRIRLGQAMLTLSSILIRKTMIALFWS